ncbi:hypothetical protein [uncultured Paraglaciecola sp.]|uniref:tetratricopeptide repeat protein n=1 Tax=uncultured Paraglaciecola sp. TaxID=1765024 RepID=UPI0030DD98F6
MTKISNSQSSRQRGVRASLIKIHAAMVNAGLHSQADIAKKIQDLEQTPSTPRSLVSRVCRSESVDPVSIERVAAALGIPGWQLYLNSTEQNIEDLEHDDLTIPTDTPLEADLQLKSRQKIPTLLVVISVMVIILVMVFRSFNNVNPDANAFPLANILNQAHKSIVSLVIWPKDILSETTASNLNQSSSITNINPSLLDSQLDSSLQSIDLARQYESDVVVTLSTKQKGRYIVQQAQMYFDGVERVIGYYVFPLANQNMYATIIAAKLQATIDQLLSHPQQSLIFDTSYMYAMDVLLDARILLDTRDMQKEGDKVTAMLLSAILEHDDIADLKGALCQTYILKSWQDEEKHHLDQAASACSEAILLDPDSPYIQALNAELDTLTGQTDSALNSYKKTLKIWPNHLKSLSGLAETYLHKANQSPTESDTALALAEQNLLRAINLEDDYWYYYETLGTIYFNLQQPSRSLAYFQLSANLSQNPVSLTNVGILTLCSGDFPKAEEQFHNVIQAAPQSHLGYQFLGLLYSYQNKSAEAIAQIKVALDKLGNQEGANIYNYWGYLADVYRWSGEQDLAISAYKQAIKALQHYKLRGVNGISEDVSQLYYEVQISNISHNLGLNKQQLITRFDLLKDQEAGMASDLKMSQIELNIGNQAESIERWTSISGQCKFYQINPDFNDVAKSNKL